MGLMSVIVVDVDVIMRFGKTYRDLGELMEQRRRVLRFDTGNLDRQMAVFGLHLHPYTGHIHGSTIGEVVADVDARLHRVANYQRKVSKVLFRHAGDAIGDRHFNWTGAVLGEVGGFFDGAIGETVEFLTDSLLPETAQIVAPVFGPILGVVLGGMQSYDKFIDLQDNGGFWEQTADALGFVAGVGGFVVGIGTTVAVLTLGATVIPYLAGAAIPFALAGFGSYLIDNRDAIGDAIVNVPENLRYFRDEIWQRGSDLIANTWDTVTDGWNSAIDTLADPISDVAYNVLTTGEQLWDSTVDVLADSVFGMVSTALRPWDWVAESWHDSVYDLLTDARSTAGAAAAALGLAAVSSPEEVDISGWAGVGIPSPTTAPEQVAEWWNGLSDAEQEQLLRVSYRRLGNLEGLPIDVRDRANRRAVLQDAASSTEDLSDPAMVERLNTLTSIREMGGKILFWDPSKDYIAVAWGDLDTASRVVVAVPGTGNNLSKFASNFGPEGHGLQEQLGDDTAVISTFTWDPPGNIVANVNIDSYQESILNDAMDNVIRTATGDDRSVVLVGHSAGADAVQAYAINSPNADLIDGYALLAAPDPEESFLDAIGDRPVLVGYHDKDPILLVDYGRPDNIADAIEAETGTGRWGADNVTWRTRESGLGFQFDPTKHHQQSTYFENFASDIADLFGPSAGGGGGGGGVGGW